MNFDNPSASTQVIEEFEGVVYACLQKLSISWSHALYDDLLQIGRLHLIEAANHSSLNPFLNENRFAFINYASKRIRWAMIDELNKEKKAQTPYKFAAEELSRSAASQLEQQLNHEWQMDVEPFVESLSDQELTFFIARFHRNESMTAIANQNGVARKTVYAWQKKTQEKSKRFLDLHPPTHSTN